MRRAPLALVLACAVLACSDEAPPQPQWVVTIATDAPPAPFFDRLLVEVLDDRGELACGSACRRVFGPTDAGEWPIVFGVTATLGAAHVRARLHRADHTSPDGLPLAPMLVDALGLLPPATGVVRVQMDLRMRCFAVPSDPAKHTTCDAGTGAVGAEPMLAGPQSAPPSVGSWPPGHTAECRGEVPSGTVCIPGGAFFLGALVTGSPITVSIPEHLVQVSPFAIDVEEMTVATVRGLVRSGAVTIQPRQVDRDPRTVDHACTWSGAANASTDALPVTCISRDGAAAVCAALGKRLPTEAEYEWAAGNLSLETDFAWGGDPDACSNGIIGRGRSLLEGPPMNGESPACRTVGSTTGLLPWGPVAGGSPRDVTQLGVKNLSGNVAELVSDGSLSYSDSCWGPSTTLLVDPHCDSPTAQALSRGGSWDRFELGARVTFREPRPREGSPTVGFRCVKAM